MSFSSSPILLTIVCLYCLTVHSGLTAAAIEWSGDWAFGCDFPGNDINQVSTRGRDCGPTCASTDKCSHFVWSPSSGGSGTCWLKKGRISKSAAIEVSDMSRVCGVNGDTVPNYTPTPRSTVSPRSHDPTSNSTCLSPTKFNEYLVTIKQEAETMKQNSETIKQHMATANTVRASIEKLTTVIQQQQDRGCDINMSRPVHNDSAIPPFDFIPPTKVWCPWRSESCTQKIQRPGQMTVAMEQQVPLPFELHLSVSNNPVNNTFVIHLSVGLSRVQLSKTVNDVTTVINETTESDYVLHDGKDNYWLSIDYQNLLVKYGQGEVRDRCTLFRSDLSKAEKNLAKEIQFIHVSFSGSRTLADYKWYEYKVKLKVGQNPVGQDPALVVVEPKDRSLDDFLKNLVMPLSRLDKPCESLYNDIVGWKFQDDAFPHLYEAIEHSIRNESGWCGKKLKEKSSRFGTSNPRATYLRITVGSNTGTSPGVPYVLEVWPPGHYSPIHAHANTYGIIRVLYGDINVKLYRMLDLKKKKPIHETTIKENQVTWLSPGLNQIHKLENKSPNKTCITIQAYEYITEEVSHYEYFDYINNSERAIDKFEPVSDIDYSEFKEIMLEEWNNKI